MIDEFRQPTLEAETSPIAIETPESKNNKRFVAKWIFACAIGYALGMPVGSMAGENIGYSAVPHNLL